MDIKLRICRVPLTPALRATPLPLRGEGHLKSHKSGYSFDFSLLQQACF